MVEDEIQVDGVTVQMRRSARRRKTVSARREGDVIVLMLPLGMSRRDEQQWAQTLVRRIVGREAKRSATIGPEALIRRAQLLAAEHLEPVVGHQVRAAEIRWVTNQEHRWGSCSTDTGVIRLSARLQTMPSWVIDYVLLHELTHLVEHNHTARFQTLLARYPLAERARGYLEGWAHARQGDGPDLPELPGREGEVD